MTPKLMEDLTDLSDLVALLVETHSAGKDVAQILLNIVRTGVQAWEDQTGKTLTPDLIRVEKAI